jgi:hypothetical protein
VRLGCKTDAATAGRQHARQQCGDGLARKRGWRIGAFEYDTFGCQRVEKWRVGRS